MIIAHPWARSIVHRSQSEGGRVSHTKSIHYYKCSLNDRLAILLYHFVVGIKSTYVKTGGRVASASSPLDVNCTRSGNNVPPTPSSWRVLGVVCEKQSLLQLFVNVIRVIKREFESWVSTEKVVLFLSYVNYRYVINWTWLLILDLIEVAPRNCDRPAGDKV